MGSNYLIGRRSFVPAYCFSLLIWVMASLPGHELQKIQIYPENPLLRIFLSDPFMHFIIFGLLTLLICIGYYKKRRPVPFINVAIIAMSYGFLIEVYQGILPWRAFGFDDFAWNTLGVLFFLGLVEVARSLTHRPNAGI